MILNKSFVLCFCTFLCGKSEEGIVNFRAELAEETVDIATYKGGISALVTNFTNEDSGKYINSGESQHIISLVSHSNFGASNRDNDLINQGYFTMEHMQEKFADAFIFLLLGTGYSSVRSVAAIKISQFKLSFLGIISCYSKGTLGLIIRSNSPETSSTSDSTGPSSTSSSLGPSSTTSSSGMSSTSSSTGASSTLSSSGMTSTSRSTGSSSTLSSSGMTSTSSSTGASSTLSSSGMTSTSSSTGASSTLSSSGMTSTSSSTGSSSTPSSTGTSPTTSSTGSSSTTNSTGMSSASNSTDMTTTVSDRESETHRLEDSGVYNGWMKLLGALVGAACVAVVSSLIMILLQLWR